MSPEFREFNKEYNDESCINCKAIFDYIKRYKPAKLDLLFEDLPPPYDKIPNIEELLTDENNWVSSALVALLFENAKKILNDPLAAFKIGYESIEKREFGYMQKLFLRSLSRPGAILEKINHLNMKLNNTKIVETVYHSPGKAVLELHWREGCVLSKDFCLFNQGIYSAIPTIWNLPPSVVEETACYFEGDPYCRYKITWESKKGWFHKLLYNISTRKSMLLEALDQIEKDKLLLKRKYQEVHNLNLQLFDRIEKLKALNSTSNYLVSTQDLHKLFDYTMKTIVRILKFDRAILMLMDEEKKSLVYGYAVGGRDEDIAKLRNYRIPIEREHNIMVRVLKRKRPVLIKDVEKAHLNPRNLIISEFKPTSFSICPLITKEGAIGVLGADRRNSDYRITEEDMDLLSIFANNIAVAIQRAKMDEELKSSYLSAVFALVRAIENKDPYTKGHSERVSFISEKLGIQLGLPLEEIEFLKIGGILHDVGKIGIPESIVKSPKKLSAAEYRIIKSHPEKGAEILEPIRFFKNHLYLIRNHHERYDGKGYPDSLRGDEIPLGAQIIAIADTFDAMISRRPYRRGLPLRQAAREIYRNAGTQFSERVVSAFKVLFEGEILKNKLQYLKK